MSAEYPREGLWSQEIAQGRRSRIVVTGIGLITPQGRNTEEVWQNIIRGKTGIREFDFGKMARDHELPELSNFPTDVKVAGQLPEDYNLEQDVLSYGLKLPPKEDNPDGKRTQFNKSKLQRMSKSVQLALAASAQTLNDAGLLEDGELIDGVDRDRFGTFIGTSVGGMSQTINVYKDLLRIQDPSEIKKKLSPFEPLIVGLERVSSVPSIVFGLTGGKATLTDACATGSQNIIEGYMDIQDGNSDIVLVGGVDAPLDPITFEMFAQMPALSRERDPNRASRPFDEARDGFVMAEGAGLLILESLEHAKKRNAKIYAEVAGYGRFSDAFHDTEPSGRAAEKSLRMALQRAGLPDSGIIYLNAHGTSTKKGDIAEVRAYKKVMSELSLDQEYKLSSTKSGSGHLMAGSGSTEAEYSVLSIRDKVVPATLHLENPMEEGNGIDLVPNDAQAANVEIAISGNFGFGGSGTNIAFKRYHE